MIVPLLRTGSIRGNIPSLGVGPGISPRAWFFVFLCVALLAFRPFIPQFPGSEGQGPLLFLLGVASVWPDFFFFLLGAGGPPFFFLSTGLEGT